MGIFVGVRFVGLAEGFFVGAVGFADGFFDVGYRVVGLADGFLDVG